MSKKILIVDDERDIIELVQYNLQKEGYVLTSAVDGTSALSALRASRPDLLILDWMIPEPNGIEVCKRIKADPALANIPIIMISAKGDEFDKVLALEIGADDYVCKPFSVRELVVRVKALLRRSYIQEAANSDPSADIIRFLNLSIDPQRYEVLFADKAILLTKTEFDLLYTMAKKPERVFTRDQLLYHVWGDNFYGDNRLVDVHIRRLRSKIEEHTEIEFVKTVRGVGYKFSEK